REFTASQIEAVEAISRQVITQLDLSAANRKLALSQERLSEERERFKTIVEDLNEVVFRADTNGRWTYLNPAWANHLGFDPQASLGEAIAARMLGADRLSFEAKLRSLVEGQVASIRPQVRFITSLGEEKIFEIFVKNCQAPDGSPFLAGTLTDLTQLFSVHAKSIEQEHYINSFYASTEFFMGVVELNATDIIMLSGNPALQKMMLADSSQKFPMSGTALGMPREVIDFWRAKYSECISAGGRSSFDYQETSGRWFRVYLAQVESAPGEIPRFSYIVTDVTEELERLRTLNTQRNLLETISEHAGDVIWMADIATGDIIFVNKAYERIWGSSRAELLRDRSTFLQPIHEADRARVMEAMPNQRTGKYEEVYRVQSPSGERWVRDRAFPVKNAAGEVVQLVGIASDITEVRHQEEALRLQKQDLELVISHLPVAICVYDAAGVREFVNEEWSRCLGWSAAEVIGKKVEPALFLTEEGHQAAREFRENVGSTREFTVFTKDKKQKVLLVSVVPLPQGKKMTVFRDLTHERSQEKIIEAQQETMIESARLSSLGEMAAGIAHEINNPLAIIQGSADLVQSAIERGGMEPEKLARSMERISTTVNRIAKIITGLKSFARDGSRDPFVPASLKSVVGEALELCQSRYRHNGVELTLDLPEEDVVVAARPVQLAQLLVNFLNNAFDAVEG
ncbi:MAG: PAS domain S-box protein, partial [Proteobacteria bacterium]